ncbi:hypothetical protein DFH08DRAFT_972123 [Mycena albidolilacea]|uniref:DUF6533 domain-containing protein n=1 Tax=Mycena albidolilacea TaxID=1033008 RepID=A0AAD6ZBU2_9AGAR|nr:hypothetical protein DFH08DRAFT_972123 [Mycena albidolilacea]
MDPATVAAQFKALETALNHITISHYASLSSMCLYLYDFMLTFSSEVKYFWGARMSLVKVLFFCTVATGSDEFWDCKAIICVAMTQVIMQMRIHALYNQNRALKIILSLLFVFEISAEFTMAIAKIATAHPTIAPIPGLQTPLSFCDEKIPKYFFAFPIPLMGFESILFALSLYKGYIHYQESPNKAWFGSRLVGIIFRDSILFFACGFSMYLLNVLIWALGPYDLFTLSTGWEISVPALAATRVLINMREVYNNPLSDTKVAEETIQLQVARRPTGFDGPTTWVDLSTV